MDTLFDSSYTQLLLKSAGFLALAFLVWLIVRRQSAALQSIYWRGAMVGLLVLAVFSLWVPIFNIQWQQATPVATTPATEVSSGWRVLSTSDTSTSIGSVAPVVHSDVTAAPSSIDPILLAGLLGSALLGCLCLLAQIRLARFRSAENLDRHWSEMMATCRRDIGIQREVRLAFSEKHKMPCAWGILRPIVMLPVEAEDWTNERQRIVLLHELAHLRRNDPLFDGLARIAVSLLWMNPLVWFAFKQLRLAAERATDDAVISSGCPAKPYASLLLQFAKEGLANRRLRLATAHPMAQSSTVGVRVEKILDGSQRRGSPRRSRAVALLVSLSLMAALVGGLQNSLAEPDDSELAPETKKATGTDYIKQKLRKIRLPEIELTEATLEEAVEELRRASVENDKSEGDPKQKGVNFIIAKGVGPNAEKAAQKAVINLQLSDVSLEDAAHFVADLAGFRYKIDPLAVIFAPKIKEDGTQLITQLFKVPHDGLPGMVPGKKNARQALEEVGVPFPDGASAIFIAATREIVVRNTAANVNLIQVFVDSVAAENRRKVINLRVEMYALPKLQALELIERYDKEPASKEAVAELRKLVAEKKARLVESPSVTTVAGQRSKVGSGTEHKYIHNYANREGIDYPLRNSIFFGTTFEVEPNIDADGETLSINLAISKTFGEPVIKRSTVKGPVSGADMPVEVIEADQGMIQTNTVLLSGQTRIIGTLSPTKTESDETILVFLKAWVTQVKK